MPASLIITRPAFTDSDSVPATTFNAVTILSATVPDATPVGEGVVRLAGDLTGGASAPQLIPSGVTAGTYGDSGENLVSITVDTKGRVTSVANRPLPPTGVAAGEYGATNLLVPNFTVSDTGRLTDAGERDITPQVLRAVMEALYPVGEILITHRTGNPADWLGFGTWVRHAEGRALVGLDENDADFDALDKTIGAKTHTLTVNEIPTHKHGKGTLATGAAGAHSHSIPVGSTDKAVVDFNTAVDIAEFNLSLDPITISDASNHTHTITGDTADAGGGQAHNNVQPSIVVAVWLRTA